MLPIYAPLPDPDQPDPADQTQFQDFTTANLPDVEDPLAAAAITLLDVEQSMGAWEILFEATGYDLADAFAELDSYAAEEDADTMADEILAAAAEDAALANLLIDLAGGTGTGPGVSNIAPQTDLTPPAVNAQSLGPGPSLTPPPGS